jgi:opacity protein-like surface antigen
MLSESQTALAFGFGAGTGYKVAPHWIVLADFRGLVAFPSDDAEGLSTGGSADPIWFERCSLGVRYAF